MKFDDFQSLVEAHPGCAVPVCRELLADTLTPVVAFLRLRSRGRPAFLFESVEGGEHIARYSFLGTDPFRSIRSHGSTVEVRAHAPDGCEEVVRTEEKSFFRVIEEEIANYESVPVHGLPPFVGGAVGFINYDSIRLIERIPDSHPREDELPDALFNFHGSVVAFDHARHRLLRITNVLPDDDGSDVRELWNSMQSRLDDLEQVLTERVEGEEWPGQIPELPPVSIAADMESNFSREDFESAVVRAKEYIAAGDAFQIVLSQRFQRPVQVDAFEVYRVLRALNPSPYLFYLQLDDTAVLGSSPEILVKVEDRKVTVRPIAGTRRRGKTVEEDLALEKDLLADDKELAEHRMLVDLGRNDVGRVAKFKTVGLSHYLTIERYSHVMHIVSEVEGELRDGVTPLEAFEAGFPAGTVSGAPKIRAMEIIDELERTRRGVYAGAVGYLDFAGNLDTCIAIRTIVIHKGIARIQAGAGIVADSVPEREYMETVHKATALFEALRLAEAGAERRAAQTTGAGGGV